MHKRVKIADRELNVEYVPVASLRPAEYNPRKWTKEATEQLTESIKRFGIVDPLLVNASPKRNGIVIGGNFRMSVFKKLGIRECPVVWVDIPNLEKERELCVRLNKNTGAFDWDALASFGENFLSDIGFSSEEVDDIFDVDETPEVFNLEKELKKLQIEKIEVRKGDVYRLGNNRVMCGDSTVEKDMLRLMNGEKADMCFTDPPYRLDYLHGKKRNGKATEGFGYKRDRKYLETDSLPLDFTARWMASIAKIAKADFSIICYESWKNVREVWGEMEKRWKVRNMIIWRLPNRVQGFSAKYKFFNKYDIAMVGTGAKFSGLNLGREEELLQNEYETALYATAGKPQWESYKKNKRFCPTDYVEHVAADEKSSGQGIVFGTKPIEILVPYVKVLTKRGALIVEPFGGSGSTLIAAEKMRRRCHLMEKSPVYTEVIKRRWEKLTGQKARKIEHATR